MSVKKYKGMRRYLGFTSKVYGVISLFLMIASKIAFLGTVSFCMRFFYFILSFFPNYFWATARIYFIEIIQGLIKALGSYGQFYQERDTDSKWFFVETSRLSFYFIAGLLRGSHKFLFAWYFDWACLTA